MFVLALTSRGVSHRLLMYQRMADALARAALTPAAEADKSRIYKMPDSKQGLPPAVGLSRGVLVGAVEPIQFDPLAETRGAQTAIAQILAAMTPAMLNQGRTPES